MTAETKAKPDAKGGDKPLSRDDLKAMLLEITDGIDVHDLHYVTGMNIDQCDEIMAKIAALRKEKA